MLCYVCLALVTYDASCICHYFSDADSDSSGQKTKKKACVVNSHHRKPFLKSPQTMPEPFAVYKSPTIDAETREFKVDPSSARYLTTDGSTTGPSAYVLKAGQLDRDKPSDGKKDASGAFTTLSNLRMQLTGLQDDINEFLTRQMEQAKNKKLKEADEQRIQQEIDSLLDGGDGDDDDGSSGNIASR